MSILGYWEERIRRDFPRLDMARECFCVGPQPGQTLCPCRLRGMTAQPVSEPIIMPDHDFTAEQVREMVRAACKRAGSIGKWAKSKGIKPQQVDSFLRGARPAEPKILKALRLERTVKYRRAK